MEERRGFLKFIFTAVAGIFLAPFRFSLGAPKSPSAPSASAANALGVSDSDQKVVRAFYAEGWSQGSRQILISHAATAAECAKLFDRYRVAFPDLKIDVQSIQRNGDEIFVRWTAQGTHRGLLDGLAPTGRRAHASGLTKMRIVDAKIVSAVAEWNEGALKNSLMTPVVL